MKLSPSLITALALLAGCSAKPLLKSSDPMLYPKKITPVKAPPSAPSETSAPVLSAQPATPITVAPSSDDPGYIVNCNGAERTLSWCYEQADEICEQQKNFVSKIVKIENPKPEAPFERALVFRCNTQLDYGRVGFPDNGPLPIREKKSSIQQKLLLGN